MHKSQAQVSLCGCGWGCHVYVCVGGACITDRSQYVSSGALNFDGFLLHLFTVYCFGIWYLRVFLGICYLVFASFDYLAWVFGYH